MAPAACATDGETAHAIGAHVAECHQQLNLASPFHNAPEPPLSFITSPQSRHCPRAFFIDLYRRDPARGEPMTLISVSIVVGVVTAVGAWWLIYREREI
jgi:hypothetical protein